MCKINRVVSIRLSRKDLRIKKRGDIVIGLPYCRTSVVLYFRPPKVVGTLCAQHLQFYADPFETFEFLSWSEDVHVVWIYSSDYYIYLFIHKFNLLIFRRYTFKVNRQWVPCAHNSSYSFMPIILKLHRCFGYGLKMCMWFGYTPQILLSLFPQVERSYYIGVYLFAQQFIHSC